LIRSEQNFVCGTVEDLKWIVIRTAILQTGLSPHGARSSTRLDIVKILMKIPLIEKNLE
jgi:hypothetical protein